MIPYTRTNWYGWSYFLRWSGSVIFRTLPTAIFAAGIALIVHAGYLDIGGTSATDVMGHPYAMQLFGMVFGFLTVSRINISYQRYWEGVTVVKTMHSKWTDACGQVINFDSVKLHSTDRSGDPFCRHIVRLFSQMSALATLRLHIEDPVEQIAFENIAMGRNPTLSPRTTKQINRAGGRPSPGVTTDPSLAVTLEHGKRHEDFKLTRAKTQTHLFKSGHGDMPLLSIKQRTEIEELLAGITPEEARILCVAACPVTATAQRIQRAIITRQNAGGMAAPPPIVSRIFQEISNGLLAYNNATKMKEIPVPFAYVQFNAAVITIFAFMAPFVIACFTESAVLAAIFSAVVVGCYYALFIVANEMEDPFGDDPNDMPMFSYHDEFCSIVFAMLTCSWAATDDWTVSSGEWVDPRAPEEKAAKAPKSMKRENTRGLLDAAKARKVTAKRAALGARVQGLLGSKPKEKVNPESMAPTARVKPWHTLISETRTDSQPNFGDCVRIATSESRAPADAQQATAGRVSFVSETPVITPSETPVTPVS